MAQLATADERAVARPLSVLVPLIKEDFAEAESAGMPYFKAAGEKLAEAREGHFRGDAAGFYAWAEKTFGKKRTQIQTYVAAAAAASDKPLNYYKNLEDARRRGLGHHASTRTTGRIHREWTATVDTIAQKAADEARRLALEESLTRQQERDAERKLALRLIDIGFKVLAKELHPDKGGSREAMGRLNRVRDRLRECV